MGNKPPKPEPEEEDEEGRMCNSIFGYARIVHNR